MSTSSAQHFRARGKLLLTGEYLVLDGAVAFAVPTQPGQTLSVVQSDDADAIYWTSLDDRGGVWFNERYLREDLVAPPPAVDRSAKARVARLLHHALAAHPQLWPAHTGLRLTTQLEFARDWGLGSSATLAYLVAAWAGADAFALNQAEFGGSGYDVACAGATGPLTYRLNQGKPIAKRRTWYPPFFDQLYFVHLGRKQDSRAGILAYRQGSDGELERYVSELNDISEATMSATSAGEFAEALRQHEALVGYVTHQEPLGRGRFADFPGVVKSLGAWGGDFVLALATSRVDVPAYFAAHGLRTVLRAGELLLNEPPPALAAEDPQDWPSFLYGVLAAPSVENEWLNGRPHRVADLLGYSLPTADDGGSRLRPQPAARVPGVLVYLSPDEVLAMDLHPEGANFRRTQGRVRLGESLVTAQVWI